MPPAVSRCGSSDGYDQSQFCDNTARTRGGDYCGKTGASGIGLPNWGYPTGYGLLQNDPPKSMHQIWSWQAAVQQWESDTATRAGSTAPYNSATYPKRPNTPAAYQFWIKQANQWWDYTQHTAFVFPAPEDLTVSGPAGAQVPVPPNSPPGCHFVAHTSLSDGYSTPINSGLISSRNPTKTYWFGDAVLMKYLAGSRRNYISWNDLGTVPFWSFHPENDGVTPNVVYQFCTCDGNTVCQTQ